MRALTGSSQDKSDLFNYLNSLPNDDTDFNQLARILQMALFGGDLAALGQSVPESYQPVWRAIMEGVSKS